MSNTYIWFAVQSQNAVTAYLQSKQLLHFAFAVTAYLQSKQLLHFAFAEQ